MSWIDDIKRFLGGPGGTELAGGKSLVDAVGHDGSASLGTGVAALLAGIQGPSWVDENLADIQVATDALQADWTDGGRLDLLLDGVKAVADALPDGGAFTSIISDLTAALADTNELQTDLADGGRLDLLIDAIKAKTDNLPTDPADESILAGHLTDVKGAGWTDENLTTIDTNIDSILADTGELQTDLADGGRLDLLVDAIKAKTDNLPTDPADESLIEAAISTSESNVRGADSDTLKTLSDQIDTLGGGIGDATLANQALIKDGNGGTFDGTTDSLEGIRDALDAHDVKLSLLQSFRDFWSDVQPLLTIGTVPATLAIISHVAIPSGLDGLPSGATVRCANLLLKFRKVEDTSGLANAINSTTMKAQVDDSVNTGWLDALTFADNSLYTAANAAEGGDMYIANDDISARVGGADTYAIQIVNAAADGNNLVLRDVQWGLRVWWS